MDGKHSRLNSFLYNDSDIERNLIAKLQGIVTECWESFNEICQDKNSQFASITEKNYNQSKNNMFGTAKDDPINEERAELIQNGISTLADHLYYGNLSVYLGDFFAASLAYHEALKMEDEDFSDIQRYLFLVVLTYYHLYDKALNIFPEIYDSLPKEIMPDAMFRVGIALRCSERVHASLQVFTQLFGIRQQIISKTKIALQISECYLQLGKYNEGIKVLEPYHIPDSLETATQLCFLMLLTDETNFADNAIRIATSYPLLSQSISLQYVAVRLMWKRNSTKEAISLISNILYVRPNHSPTWVTLGLIYTCNGQLQDALKAFGMAIRYEPSMIEAWANFGAILELDPSLGDPIAFYKQAITKTKSEIHFKTRIELIEKNIERKPTMIEPNDREYFETPGKEQAMTYLMSTPEIPPKLVSKKNLSTSSKNRHSNDKPLIVFPIIDYLPTADNKASSENQTNPQGENDLIAKDGKNEEKSSNTEEKSAPQEYETTTTDDNETETHDTTTEDVDSGLNSSALNQEADDERNDNEDTTSAAPPDEE